MSQVPDTMERPAEEPGSDGNFKFLSKEEGQILKMLVDFLVFQPEGGKYIRVAEAIDRGLSQEKISVKYGDLPWKGEFYKQGIAEMEKAYKDMKSKSMLEDRRDNINDFLDAVLSGKKNSFLKRFLGEVVRRAVAICYSRASLSGKIGFPAVNTARTSSG